MADENQKYWIVLVNKVPQGPYTEAQVKELLNQNKFRRNDVGMQVSEDGSISLSGWKILWQFPEFDRRRNKKQPAPGGKERRRELTNPEIEIEKREKIPDHLLDIHPEELLLGQRDLPINFAERLEDELDIADEREPKANATASGGYGKYAVAGAAVFFLFFVVFRSPSEPPMEKPVRAPMVERAPAESATKTERLPLSKLRPRKRPVMQLPKQAPPQNYEGETDSGDVPPSAYDDVREEEEENEAESPRIRGRKPRVQKAVPLNEDFYDDEEASPEDEVPADQEPLPEEEEQGDVEYYD